MTRRPPFPEFGATSVRRARSGLRGAAAVLALVASLAGLGYSFAALVVRGSDPNRSQGARNGENATPDEIAALVHDLGSEDWKTRSASTLRLIEIGDPALPELRNVLSDGDPEEVWRAEEAIREIEWRRREEATLRARR